jgi:hypothetical protein
MNGTSAKRLVLLSGTLIVATPTAQADEPPSATSAEEPSADAIAAAQGLFVEGKHLVSERRYDEGCTKLEHSYRLDPAVGTQINLADCYEKSGKIAKAWFAFHEAVVAAEHTRRADWADQARQRAASLEARVPRLTIVVDEPLSNPQVSRDGTPIRPSTYGSPVPIDPGSYEIAATAAHRRGWITHVSVEVSEHVVLHIPALVEDPSIGARGMEPRNTATAVAPAPPTRDGARSVQRAVSLTLGAVAIGVGGVGTFTGLSAIANNNSAANRCPTSPRCTDVQAIRLTDDAQRDATISTVSFVAGGVLLAAATTLLFTAPGGGKTSSIGLGLSVYDVVLGGYW